MQTTLHLILEPSPTDWHHWQELVNESKHPSAFADSYFLKNHAHPNTKTALVLLKKGDKWAGGMPLFYRQRLLIKWLVQVPFIQRCVWVGEPLSKQQKIDLTNRLKRKFVKGVFNSEVDLLIVDSERHNSFLVKTESWRDQYSKDLSKNLRRANKKPVMIQSDISNLAEIIDLYREVYGRLNPHLKQEHYNKFRNVTNEAALKNKAMVLTVKTTQENELLAGLVFWKGLRSYHYVMGAPTKSGRKSNALSVALDYMIQEVLRDNEILDFEGSSIPSVRRFYNAFGGSEEVFFTLRR